MDEQKLLNAMNYANQNPGSDVDIELRKRFSTGEFDSVLTERGLKPQKAKKDSFLKTIGKSLIKSETEFGQSIAGAADIFSGGRLGGGKRFEEAQTSEAQTISQLINVIKEKRDKGEDPSRFQKLLKDMSRTSVGQDELLERQAGLSTRQVVGQGLGVATDIIGAGTLATKGAGVVTKPTSFFKGGLQGAGTGALVGGGFGSAQGFARGLQEDKQGSELATQAISSGVAGGVAGGVLGGITGAVSGAFRGKALRKQELVDLIKNEELTNTQLARVNIVSKQVKNTKTGQIETKLDFPKDKVAKEAVKQGLDDADVVVIKTASEGDKKIFREMFNLSKKAKGDRKILERPSDMMGTTVLEPAKFINKTLQTTARKLDDVANGLKGKTVNRANEVISSINDDITGIGARVDDKGKIVFTGSDLEGLGSNEKLLQNVYRRLLSAKDAHDYHRLKRFIDSNVDFGKGGEGLTGQAERILKGWRRTIDEALDSQFVQYNNVNTTLSKTIQSLDDLHTILGSKFKINAPFAEIKAGTVANRILSNSPNRGDVLRVLNDLQKLAKEFGFKTDKDIISEVVFVDILEDAFGTQATRSFRGQITRAIGDAGAVVQDFGQGQQVAGLGKLTMKAVERLQGINQQAKIEALAKLIGVR